MEALASCVALLAFASSIMHAVMSEGEVAKTATPPIRSLSSLLPLGLLGF